MGELHLDIKIDILRRTYKVDANIGQPQVAYREKLTRRVEIDYTHKKQTGGTGQFARVKFTVEPNEPGAGFSSSERSWAVRCRRNTSPASRRAWNSVLGAGILAGFPVVDIKVELIDGAYHEVDLSALAFEIASRAGARRRCRRAARCCSSR